MKEDKTLGNYNYQSGTVIQAMIIWYFKTFLIIKKQQSCSKGIYFSSTANLRCMLRETYARRGECWIGPCFSIIRGK